MYITFSSTKNVKKAEPTRPLKPRGDVTRNPKQGYQWPPKKDVCSTNFFFTKNTARNLNAFLKEFFDEHERHLEIINYNVPNCFGF